MNRWEEDAVAPGLVSHSVAARTSWLYARRLLRSVEPGLAQRR